MRGINARTDQRTPNVVPRPQRLAHIRAVVRVDVDPVLDPIAVSEIDQLARQPVVVRAAAVLGADRDGVLIRSLARPHCRHVDRDHLGHVGRNAGRRAVPDLLENRKVQVRRPIQLNRTLQDRLRDAQADRRARLVVQVPRLDVPALRDRRLRVEADKVADCRSRACGRRPGTR